VIATCSRYQKQKARAEFRRGLSLSEVRSATGEIRVGEGVLGLARAFAVAGAANIVLSAWDAADDETRELMTLFYTARRNGEPSHRALRQAKLRLRALGWHPFFWGGFFLQGGVEATHDGALPSVPHRSY